MLKQKKVEFSLLDKIKAFDAILKAEFLNNQDTSHKAIKTRQALTKMRELLAKTIHQLTDLNNQLF